jgi:hypothetical protein
VCFILRQIAFQLWTCESSYMRLKVQWWGEAPKWKVLYHLSHIPSSSCSLGISLSLLMTCSSCLHWQFFPSLILL